MSQRYKVTHVPHFIGGRMVYPDCGEDSIVSLPVGVKAGRWLKEVGETGSAKYAVAHISRGDYVVELVEDGSRASVVFKHTGTQGEAKELAEAEAARLNCGGDPILPESNHSQDNSDGGGGNLPDA